MSDDEEDAPPLLNALTTAKSSYILKEVGRVTAEAMWDLHARKVWSNPNFDAELLADSDDEAALAEMTETHVLGALARADLLVVRAAADPTDSAPLLRRLRALFLALLRAGYVKATLHANNRAKLDSLPSLQTDIECAFSFPAMVPETCEALVKDTIKDAVVQVLGHDAADSLRDLLASPKALNLLEVEMADESDGDEGGDIDDTSDEEEEGEDDDEASGEEEEASEEETEEGGSPPPKRCKE